MRPVRKIRAISIFASPGRDPAQRAKRCRSAFAAALMISAVNAFAQSPEVSIQEPPSRPFIGHLISPFHVEKRIVPPVKLANSPRLESLVRSGNLYLSVRDVIALALENNLDIAIQRYGPFLQREILRRAEGGAPLRNVGVPIFAGPQSVSLAGVSVNANALSENGAAASGAGIVTSIGTLPPTWAVIPSPRCSDARSSLIAL